jgi:hypothetical protein
MCDVIPGVVQEFRGAVGTLNRPYAIPNDDGEEILVRVRPGVCDPGSPGFVDLPGGVEPEDDYFVTVLFEPPGAVPRNAVVIESARNRTLGVRGARGGSRSASERGRRDLRRLAPGALRPLDPPRVRGREPLGAALHG